MIDGHGQNGAEASEYIKQRFHTNLEQELENHRIEESCIQENSDSG